MGKIGPLFEKVDLGQIYFAEFCHSLKEWPLSSFHLCPTTGCHKFLSKIVSNFWNIASQVHLVTWSITCFLGHDTRPEAQK